MIVSGRDKSFSKRVPVRCLDYDTEYSATVVHEFFGERGFVDRHEDPPSGLCPVYNGYRREKL
jgi:hypothetical protein